MSLPEHCSYILLGVGAQESGLLTQHCSVGPMLFRVTRTQERQPTAKQCHLKSCLAFKMNTYIIYTGFHAWDSRDPGTLRNCYICMFAGERILNFQGILKAPLNLKRHKESLV